MDEQELLTLTIGARFDSLDEAARYATLLERIARKEGEAAQAARDARRATEEAARARGTNQWATAFNGAVPPAGRPVAPSAASGPNARLAAAEAHLDALKRQGGSPEALEDARWRLDRAQGAVERMRRQPMDPATQALYSTRVNLPGGAAPLVGKTLDALVGPEMTKKLLAAGAPLARFLGPLGVIASVGGAAAQALSQAAEALQAASVEAAQAHRALGDIRATLGGSTVDAARALAFGAVSGVDPSAARAFQERITSSPEAMAAAGQIGISNRPAPYGNMDFGRQYLDAIERTSRIADESQRRRMAYLLGIEQEVARWSLLSEQERRKVMDQAGTIGGRASTRAQQDSAMAESARLRREAAEAERSAALADLFKPQSQRAFAEDAEARIASQQTAALRGFAALFRGEFAEFGKEMGAAFLGGGQRESPKTAEVQKQSATERLAETMEETNAQLSRLNRNVGGGALAGSALPSALRGANLQIALEQRALALGGLG